MNRRGLILLAAALLALGAMMALNRDALALALFRRGAQQAMSADTIASLGPGLHAALCGTGSPLPDRARAGPCLAVIAGGRLFLIDAGEGAGETLALMGLPAARIEGVFLTHFHSDHIDGLGALMLQHWAGGGAAAPLPLYGPEGVEAVAAGFNDAYRLDSGYRIGHHGPDIVPPSGFGLAPRGFASSPNFSPQRVYERDGVRILAFPVDHGPVSPAIGYRIDYAGRSLVVSGDTRADAPSLVNAAQAADILVHETLSPRLTRILGATAKAQGQDRLAQIFQDIENYHTTPAQAAQLAKKAKVRALVLTHLVPAPRLGLLDGPFLDGAGEKFSGPVWLAHDGDVVSIAPDGRIRRKNLLR